MFTFLLAADHVVLGVDSVDVLLEGLFAQLVVLDFEGDLT